MEKQGFNPKTLAEASMKEQVILEETRGFCRTLTLNRPEAKNAYDFELAAAISAALAKAAKDRKLKVVVVRGAGGAFSAGGDIKLFHQNLKTSDQAFRKISGHLNRAIRTIGAMPQIVIAAVQGPAYAAGFGLALACDLTVASHLAKLSPSFINIALAPNAASTFYLPRLIGPKRALEAFLTGRVFAAPEAHALGLVNHVWPEESFEEELSRYVQDLVARPTLSLTRIKRMLRASLENPLGRQIEMEKREIAASSLSKDFTEGVTAFIEKRKPVFRGK